MAFDHNQIRAANLIILTTALECAQNPFANLSEHHIKAVCLGALLRNGFSVMEGSNKPGMGRVVALREEQLVQEIRPRPHMPPAPGSSKKKNSPDIRVWEPSRLVVEMQVRSDFGSQSASSTENVADDLGRIDRNSADLFVLAADLPQYLALRGVKSDSRGRKPLHIFDKDLPLPVQMSSTPIEHAVDANGRRAVCLLTKSSFGVSRAVCAVWSAA